MYPSCFGLEWVGVGEWCSLGADLLRQVLIKRQGKWDGFSLIWAAIAKKPLHLSEMGPGTSSLVEKRDNWVYSVEGTAIP